MSLSPGVSQDFFDAQPVDHAYYPLNIPSSHILTQTGHLIILGIAKPDYDLLLSRIVEFLALLD
jgi:hypothetical protein